MSEMKKRGRRAAGCCWWAGVGTIAGFAALAAYVLKPEPGLLDHAVRFADARSWAPQYGGYFWETSHSVLTFRPSGKGARAVTVETGSGVETARTALSAQLQTG